MPHRIAVVDIGSNSLKFSVTEIDAEGQEHIIVGLAETVRLATGVASTGTIEPHRFDLALAALRHFEEQARALRVEALWGVATAALRMASNGGDLLDRIAGETSWQVRVISGDEEASLAFEGLRRELPSTGTCVIADIGGASTELIRVEDGTVAAARSIEIGSGTLADRSLRTDPPGLDAVAVAGEVALQTFQDVDVLAPAGGAPLFLTGGNGLFLSGISFWDKVRLPFVPEFFRQILEKLAVIPASEVANYLGIAEERARVLPAGGAIALALVRLIQPVSLHAVQSGIRGGLVREWMDAGFPPGPVAGSTRPD
jgi:exopolyphosphatase/guanosine-5'-triphosphate,3'-diphosphate pyrophosphatase